MAKEYLGCSIDAEVKKDVETMAKSENRSVSNMVEVILKRGVTHLVKNTTPQVAV